MVSVNDILAHTPLSLESVVLADGNANVRWVATSELADPSPFMEGGEILLTTGLVPRDDAGWHALVTALVDAGVIAMGFGVGLSYPSVPPGLRDAAAELKFNLFVVPRPVPFIAVSRAVADLLWAAERDVDRQSFQYQRALTQAALRPFERSPLKQPAARHESTGANLASGTVLAHTVPLDGMSAIIETLAEIVAGEIAVATASGAVRAATVDHESAAALLLRAAPLLKRLDATNSRGAATEILRESRLTVHPVGSDARAELFLMVETAAPASQAQRTAITMAHALLTLEIERSRAARIAERKVSAGALALALRGDLAAAGALLEGAVQHASIPADRLRVVRARGSDRELDRALSGIEARAASLGFPLVARVASGGDSGHLDQIVVLLQPDSSNLTALLEPLSLLEVGVGPAQDASSIAHSDQGARQALALATAARPVVQFSELTIEGVDALLDAGKAAAYAHNLLEPITEREDAEELLASVRAFLIHNGQVGPAALALGVHRNTLHGRLSRVESALGRTLNDPQLRADLWVALKYVKR